MGIPILGRIEAPGTGRGRRLRLGRREHAGDRPRRAHQPGRHPADGRPARAARHRGARLRPAALAWRGSLPASDVGDQPARRRSGAGLFAAAAGRLLPAAEGARHPAGRRRRRGVPRTATASASTCCRPPARGDRGRRLPEDRGRDGGRRLHGADLRGRCAVHRLRGRPDLPDAAGAAQDSDGSRRPSAKR